MPTLISSDHEPCLSPTPARYDEALAVEWYDVITAQLFGGGSNYVTDLEAVVAVVEAANAGVAGEHTRVLLYSSWPQRYVDFADTWGYELPEDDPLDETTYTRHSLQYLRLIAADAEEITGHVVGVLPVAEVLLRLLETWHWGDAGSDWLYRDDVHVTYDPSSYIVNATVLSALHARPLPETFTSAVFYDRSSDYGQDEQLIRDTIWQTLQDIPETLVHQGPRWWCEAAQ